MTKFSIYLSPVAEYKLIKVLEYIEMEFGEKSKIKFLKKFSERTKAIEMNPYSFIETDLDGIFKCVVTKQTSFFYRILSTSIEILTVSDNRQNPDKVFKELLKL